MALSLADTLIVARQMVTALTANQAQVAKRGVTQEFIDKGTTVLERAEALNIQQERLKADLKQKTAELEAAFAELKDWHTEANSTVKLAYRDQQQKWVEFGIKAKR